MAFSQASWGLEPETRKSSETSFSSGVPWSPIFFFLCIPAFFLFLWKFAFFVQVREDACTSSPKFACPSIQDMHSNWLAFSEFPIVNSRERKSSFSPLSHMTTMIQSDLDNGPWSRKETGQGHTFSIPKSRGDTIKGMCWNLGKQKQKNTTKVNILVHFLSVFFLFLDLILFPSRLFLYMVYFNCDNDV